MASYEKIASEDRYITTSWLQKLEKKGVHK